MEEMIKVLLERADINRRLPYSKLVWPPLNKIWTKCHLIKPSITNIDELLKFVKPILALEPDNLEITLQCSVALAAKLLTCWEVILEPACFPGKTQGTRTKGFCDLLIITSPFNASLFEFKRDFSGTWAAAHEVTGYMVIQNTKTLKILEEGREEEFWADQLSFDRYAVTGQNGLSWDIQHPDIVKTKIERTKHILFPHLCGPVIDKQ